MRIVCQVGEVGQRRFESAGFGHEDRWELLGYVFEIHSVPSCSGWKGIGLQRSGRKDWWPIERRVLEGKL